METEITRDAVLEQSAHVAMPSGLQWLRTGVALGLGVLYTLNLEHKPAADTIRVTIEGFLGALLADGRTWDRERDAWRIAEAFRRLGLRSDFPRPAHLLAALPPVKPTAEEVAEHYAMLAQQHRNRNEARARLEQPALVIADDPLAGVDFRLGFKRLRAAVGHERVQGYDPLPPKEDAFARANWVRRHQGQPEFATREEYEQYVAELQTAYEGGQDGSETQ